jgi:hypothetical protein
MEFLELEEHYRTNIERVEQADEPQEERHIEDTEDPDVDTDR